MAIDLRGQQNPFRNETPTSGERRGDKASTSKIQDSNGDDELIHAILRAGLDPRDGNLTVDYVFAIAGEHLRYENQISAKQGYYAGLGYAAWKTGDEDMMNSLQEMAFGTNDQEDQGSKDEDLLTYSQMTGLSIPEVMEKIAKGWQPPKINRR